MHSDYCYDTDMQFGRTLKTKVNMFDKFATLRLRYIVMILNRFTSIDGAVECY